MAFRVGVKANSCIGIGVRPFAGSYMEDNGIFTRATQTPWVNIPVVGVGVLKFAAVSSSLILLSWVFIFSIISAFTYPLY